LASLGIEPLPNSNIKDVLMENLNTNEEDKNETKQKLPDFTKVREENPKGGKIWPKTKPGMFI
jgi:hypothetical protein